MSRQARDCGRAVLFIALSIFFATAALAAQAAETVKLHYFTWAGGGSAETIRRDWIEPFEMAHPNVKVEYEAVAFGQFFEKLTTYIAAGNPPDLIHMSVGFVYDYAQRGLLTNLDPYFNRDLRASDFFMEPAKAVRAPSMETGALYAIPFGFVEGILYYNKDAFAQGGLLPPNRNWTWDDLRAVSKKLTFDADGNGQPDRWGFWSTADYKLFDALLHSFGGATLNDDYTKVVFDQPATVQGVKFLRDMIWEDGSAPPPSAWQGNLFSSAKVAMHVDNISSITTYRQAAAFDWEVALLPKGPARRVVRVWPDSFAIPSGSKHKEEAWALIKSSITRKQLDEYNGVRKIPFYKALATSPAWLERDQKPNKQVFLDAVQYGDPLEFRPRWGEWEGRRKAEIEKALRNEVPVETAVKMAADVVRGVLGLK